jgi:parallel beta-helix repeat protein
MRKRLPVLVAVPLLTMLPLAAAVAVTTAGSAPESLTRGGYLMAERKTPLPPRAWLKEAAAPLATCAALPPAPKPAAGELQVIGLTKDRYFNKFFQGGGKLYRLVGQQKGVPMAIVLGSGQWRLAQLQAALAAHPGAMQRQGQAYLLRLPLLVQAGAGIIVQKGEALRLSRDRGAFIINLGTLHLSQARLEAWDEVRKAPATAAVPASTSASASASTAAPAVKPATASATTSALASDSATGAATPISATETATPVAPATTAAAVAAAANGAGFQPFLLGWSGSRTVIHESTVSGLGFAEGLSHGLEFAAGPIGLAGLELPAPPKVFISGSELSGLYSGVHATAVPELRICRNRFLGSRLNAVHLDIGSGGIVADNLVTGTEGPYALYFNKNASNVWVLRNDISENRRSGLSINDSADIVIAGNTIRQNFDAVFLQASERILFADNEILDNQRHGVSLRDAGPVRLQNDRIGPNRGVGILAKKAKVPDVLAGTAAKFIPEVKLAKDAPGPAGATSGLKPAAATVTAAAAVPQPAVDSLGRVEERGPAPAVAKSAIRSVPVKRDPGENRVELVGVLLEGNHSSAMEVEAPYNIVFDHAEVMYPDVRRRPVFRGVLNDFESDILFRLPRRRTLEFEPLKVKAKASAGATAGKPAPSR